MSKLDDEFSGVFPDFLHLYDIATTHVFHFLFLDLKRVRAFADLTRLLYQAPS